jgi:hypothetical protein
MTRSKLHEARNDAISNLLDVAARLDSIFLSAWAADADEVVQLEAALEDAAQRLIEARDRLHAAIIAKATFVDAPERKQ